MIFGIPNVVIETIIDVGFVLFLWVIIAKYLYNKYVS
jgi:hypothetical protein